jgi:hypothetical protein
MDDENVKKVIVKNKKTAQHRGRIYLSLRISLSSNDNSCESATYKYYHLFFKTPTNTVSRPDLYTTLLITDIGEIKQ